jgi:hypothetical protein
MSSPLRIIVTGLIAQHPTLGGVTWDYLQYVIGLAQLGHEVYYFEDSGEWPYHLDGGPTGSEWIAYDCSQNVNYLAKVMERYGLGDRWAYRFPIKPRWYGMSHLKRREVLASADLLINVSGTLKRPTDYRQVRRLAYIDSDPVFTQIKLNLPRGQGKFQKRVAAHDVFFSFGEHFSEQVPETKYQWRPTRTPIVLSEWRPAKAYREVFTTVMSWTSYKPLVYGGQSYAQKDVEFKRFLQLASMATPTILEVAMGKTQHVRWQSGEENLPAAAAALHRDHPQWTPWELLQHMGWKLVDSIQICGDLDRYREYVESSKAEWSVAKNGYVRGQSGWFSCRSACYLAAGRPAVVQDTGFTSVIPAGEGLLTFTTPDEAADAIRRVTDSYTRHAKAARALAEEYFDSRKVLTRLVEQAMTAE